MDKTIEKKIVSAVANGETYLSQQKKYNISYDKVKRICSNYHVKSKYSDTSYDDIITVIKKHKVVSMNVLSKELHRKPSNLLKLIIKLLHAGKVYQIRIPHTKSKSIKNDFLKKHMNKRLFYVSDKQLKEWIIEQLPDNMPKHFKKSISQRLHDAGVDIDLSSNSKYKSICLPEQQYNDLKKEAKKQNKTIRELILKNGGIKNGK